MEDEEGPGKNLDLKHRQIRQHLKEALAHSTYTNVPKDSMMALNDRISKATSAWVKAFRIIPEFRILRLTFSLKF